MNSRIVFSTLLFAAAMAQAQEPSPYNERRNAAAGFVGTLHFAVGRMAYECRAELGKPESWVQETAQAWRVRNDRYWRAHVNYMSKQLEAALAAGGESVRKRLSLAYAGTVRKEASAIVESWLRPGNGSKREACERYVKRLEEGAEDIHPGGPMSAELEDLAQNFQAK
jgi:hypothetical protein